MKMNTILKRFTSCLTAVATCTTLMSNLCLTPTSTNAKDFEGVYINGYLNDEMDYDAWDYGYRDLDREIWETADENETREFLKKLGLKSNLLPTYYYSKFSDAEKYGEIPEEYPQATVIPNVQMLDGIVFYSQYGSRIKLSDDKTEALIYMDPNSGWCDDLSAGPGEDYVELFYENKIYFLYIKPTHYYQKVMKEKYDRIILDAINEVTTDDMTQAEKMEAVTYYFANHYEHTSMGGSMIGVLFYDSPGDCWAFADILAEAAELMGYPCFKRSPYLVGEAASKTHANVCVLLDGESYIADASGAGSLFRVADAADLHKFGTGIKVTPDGLYAYTEDSKSIWIKECYSFDSTIVVPETINDKIIQIISEGTFLNQHTEHIIIPDTVRVIVETCHAITLSDVKNYSGELIFEKHPTDHELMSETSIMPAGTKFTSAGIYFPDKEVPEDVTVYDILEEDMLVGGWYTGTWKPYIYLTDDELATSPEPEITLGNVNGDDKIDATDAAVILKESALIGATGSGIFTEQQISAGDVNGDGVVNASDAAVILTYAANVGAGHEVSITDIVNRTNIQ